METLNFDQLENYQETLKTIKEQLIDAMRAELKRTASCMWDFHAEISAHYPHSGSILVHNIKTLCIDGSSVACGCSIGDPTSKGQELVTCDLSAFDCETILETLTQLRKELRALRLAMLKNIVREHGGFICFDGSFKFIGDTEGRNSKECVDPCEGCSLTKLEIVDDKLVVFDTWHGEPYDNSTDFIPDYELDRIMLYARQQPRVNVSLTAEQEEAVENLKAAFQKLADLDVECIYEIDYGILQFWNKKKIMEYEVENYSIDPVRDGYIDITGQIDNNQHIEGLGYYNSLNSEHIYVKTKS